MTGIAKLAIGCLLVCSLIALLAPQAWADAAATEQCHAFVVTVARDQLSLDVRLLPSDSNPNCKPADSKPQDSKKTDSTTPSSAGCSQSLNATCDVTHLIVTDNLIKDQLKQLLKGDKIQVVFSTETKKATDKNTAAESPTPAKEKNPPDTKTSKDTKDTKTTKDTKSAETEKSKDADKEKSTDAKNSADAKIQYVLKAWCVDFESPSAWLITGLLLASAGACLLLTLLFSSFKPTQLIISEDNRYSNSRFQMTLWFFVLITTYIAALWLRVCELGWDFTGGVNTPQNLLVLSGMSALTYAGAKAITSSKMAAPATAGQPSPSDQKAPAPEPNFFLDLTHNDGIPAVPAQDAVLGPPAAPGLAPTVKTPAVAAKDAVPPQFDFGDFQMLIVTLLAAVTYIVLVFNFFGHVEYSKIVTLPDVDNTILAAFGLGQAAYLTKKAVGNVGTS